MALGLTLMIFGHIEGAERAYADVLDISGDTARVHEIAFVEHHRHDRIVVRGTFAGRGGRLVRHHLSSDAAQTLEAAVAGSPPAAEA